LASEFRTIRRVAFSETDMAGIMHFAHFFRWMEDAEHAFLRSLGFSVHQVIDGRTIGWPRVRAECEYHRPLRFEDEVEIELRVREKRPKSLTYDFTFRTLQGEAVARGSLTVVCAAIDASGRIGAIEIPPAMAAQIEPAP